ncbi:hypothetical protein SAMN05518849_11283 [Sphingobium sp. AP50]|nr:hypothetical protein SAMN05518849_11283 [Sphingobium sp. AP50]
MTQWLRLRFERRRRRGPPRRIQGGSGSAETARSAFPLFFGHPGARPLRSCAVVSSTTRSSNRNRIQGADADVLQIDPLRSRACGRCTSCGRAGVCDRPPRPGGHRNSSLRRRAGQHHPAHRWFGHRHADLASIEQPSRRVRSARCWKAAGVVIRPRAESSPATVTLTAKAGESEKQFALQVQPRPKPQKPTRYLFALFTNGPVPTTIEEQI